MPTQSATLAKQHDEHESGEQPASRIAAESESAQEAFDLTRPKSWPTRFPVNPMPLEGTENVNVKGMLQQWENWIEQRNKPPEGTRRNI